MQTFTANEAKNRFGEFLDLAQHGPVRIARRGSVVGVLVSAHDYEAMRVFYADRLRQTLEASTVSATNAVTTADELDTLLADEN